MLNEQGMGLAQALQALGARKQPLLDAGSPYAASVRPQRAPLLDEGMPYQPPVVGPPRPKPIQSGDPDMGVLGRDGTPFKNAIQLLEGVLHHEPDDVDSAELAKILQGLYRLLANRQKEMDDSLGGKLSPRMMRRGA